MPHAYCVACKEMIEPHNGKVVSKTYYNRYGTPIKRKQLQGTCPICGNKVSSFMPGNTPTSHAKATKKKRKEITF
jgi:hypothetical protein